MNKQLIVRMYKVGFGDCIHLIVPNEQDQEFHILIDCGALDPLADINTCVDQLIQTLPVSTDGKKHIDLLVVSHPHEDHDKGFTSGKFNDLRIDRIWLSPAFLPESLGGDQMKEYFALKTFRNNVVTRMAEYFRVDEGNILDELAERFSLSKKETMDMLTTDLPGQNQITPEYVTAETDIKNPIDFHDPHIQLEILGPEMDVDGCYVGKSGLTSEAGTTPFGMRSTAETGEGNSPTAPIKFPANISHRDFQLLREAVQPDAYSLFKMTSVIENNLSVVVLLTWYGRRLLFCGDAEYTNTTDLSTVRSGRNNGSWNVMWARHNPQLNSPLDFYKVGHHGSVNATPWKKADPITGEESPLNEILNKILPYPQNGGPRQGYAVVSTRRKNFASIPDPDLMMDLGKRVINFDMDYVEEATDKITPDDLVPPNTAQPQRTDLDDEPAPYIETAFTPKI